MAGRRLDRDSLGESYEVFAESLLNRIATLTRIGTKQDFGTDTYCQPRIGISERTETVTELCLLQVKGGSSRLVYGGVEDKVWKGYEFEWLKGLWAPLYLVHVDKQYRRADLYSLWPIWWVLWQAGTPFKVICKWTEPSDSVHDYCPPTSEPAPEAVGFGDGRIWRVDLGTPLLSLTHQLLNDTTVRNHLVNLFRYWIRVDRQTVARYNLQVPLVEMNHSWITNQVPSKKGELLVMSSTPGALIEPIARALAPAILGLGSNMQQQGNKDAFMLIPVLEWLQSNGYGTLLTGGLLEKLTRSRNEGVSPNTYL
jgi:hypothetical protein